MTLDQRAQPLQPAGLRVVVGGQRRHLGRRLQQDGDVREHPQRHVEVLPRPRARAERAGQLLIVRLYDIGDGATSGSTITVMPPPGVRRLVRRAARVPAVVDDGALTACQISCQQQRTTASGRPSACPSPRPTPAPTLADRLLGAAGVLLRLRVDPCRHHLLDGQRRAGTRCASCSDRRRHAVGPGGTPYRRPAPGRHACPAAARCA